MRLATTQEPRLIAWLKNPGVKRTVTLAVLWLFLGWVLFRFRETLMPFGLALLLAFIIEPLVDFLETRALGTFKIPRLVALALVYLVVGGVGVVFFSWALARVTTELAGLGSVTQTIVQDMQVMASHFLDQLESFSEQANLPVDRQEMEAVLQQNISAAAEGLQKDAAGLLTVGRNLVSGTFRAVFGTFLVLMLTAFLTIDRERILRFVYSLVPPQYQSAYRTIMQGISMGLAGVVRGQVTICLTNGILTFIGLWIIGVKLPLILATVAAVFSLVPIFGSILSTIPIVAMALTDSITKGLFALFWIIAIHLIEANFLNPKIMGDAAKIHPVVVVFVLIAGEHTAGLMGALFAVPVAAVVVTIFKFVHQRVIAETV